MNILNIQLNKNHFHTLLQLNHHGHNVYTNWHGAHEYENLFGIKTLSATDNTIINVGNQDQVLDYVYTFIKHYDIDVLQVSDPTKSYLHTHFHKLVKLYIGPSEKVARLETDKLFAKRMADTVNIKTPAILKQGKYSDADYCTNLTFPTIEKPSNFWAPAVNYFSEEEAKKAIELRDKGSWPYSGNPNDEYFIEEYIDDMIETNVFFVISNGEYRITHTQQIIGENENKTIEQKVWYIGSYIQPLTPEVDKIVRKQAEPYLEKIAKMGGNYEGSFCGAYTSSGDWYFLETNVRPDVFNSTPTFMTGDDYLKGYIDDINLFEEAWEGKTCDKLLITTLHAEEEYPIHLHEKYEVALPNNLEYKDNKFYVSKYGTDHDKGCGTVVSDFKIPKEFVQEVESTTHWKFNEEPIR